jgi:hypothetical protein
MTGIAFNVILVRSSVTRDKQFRAFDHTEQTLSLPESFQQRSAFGGTVGSVKVIQRQSRPQQFELTPHLSDHNTKADKLSSQSDTDFYRGIRVTKDIVHSSQF